MKSMKTLFVMLDGLADRPAPELGDRTPLQAAATPNLDALAARGACGTMYALAPGLAPSTELAHWAIFGYTPAEFPGRAVFEAVGEGMELETGQVVARGSFVSVQPSGGGGGSGGGSGAGGGGRRHLVVAGRAFDITDRECSELALAVSEHSTGGVTVRYIYNSHRQGILLLDGATSAMVTDSDPFADGLPVIKAEPLDGAGEDAGATASALNAYLRWIFPRLDGHRVNEGRRERGLEPANFLVSRWTGRKSRVRPFRSRYGLRATAVLSGAMLKGLFTEMGLAVADVPEAATPGETVSARLARAREALAGDSDMAFVHSKAADEASHRKSPDAKRDAIESLDRALGEVARAAGAPQAGGTGAWPDDLTVVVTADHSTPSRGPLIHGGDSVPLVIAGPNVRVDGVASFDELSCIGGALGQLRGNDVMPVILNLTDRVRYQGGRPTPHWTAHQPEDFNALEI